MLQKMHYGNRDSLGQQSAYPLFSEKIFPIATSGGMNLID
jgi:hypothetical protein